jgi:hypothetical protein
VLYEITDSTNFTTPGPLALTFEVALFVRNSNCRAQISRSNRLIPTRIKQVAVEANWLHQRGLPPRERNASTGKRQR